MRQCYSWNLTRAPFTHVTLSLGKSVADSEDAGAELTWQIALLPLQRLTSTPGTTWEQWLRIPSSSARPCGRTLVRPWSQISAEVREASVGSWGSPSTPWPQLGTWLWEKETGSREVSVASPCSLLPILKLSSRWLTQSFVFVHKV